MTPLELEDVCSRWVAAMKCGDFEAAWRQTDRIERERRALEAAGRFERRDEYLSWNGKAFDRQRVLVRCAHGLGDTIQFARYVPLIRRLACSVCLLVQPQLLPLFAGTSDFGDVRNGWTDEAPPEHDIEIEVMELPYAFRSTVETLPRSVPYLPLANRTRWDQALHGDVTTAFKVGLLWAASDWDKTRSIPLDALAALGALPHVEFYSLQQGSEAGEWSDARFPLQPLHRHTREIAAAAAAMCRLDLVITVDSMAAHLAGALGRPVWVLLRHEADWRWMIDGNDSPWYPMMRLFRQKKAGDWKSVVEKVAAELADVVARGGHREPATGPAWRSRSERFEIASSRCSSQ
jgi:hypothetical protein